MSDTTRAAIAGAEARIEKPLYAFQLGQGIDNLRFVPELEAEFRADYARRSLPRLRIGLMLAIGLYVTFLLVRLLAESGPATLWGLGIRAIVIGAMAAALAASYTALRRHMRTITVFTYFVFGAGVTGIEIVAHHFNIDRRYEGLIFICIHCYVFGGLLFRQALVTTAVIFATYLVGGTLGGLGGKQFGYELFFIFLINVLGAGGLEHALHQVGQVEVRERAVVQRHRHRRVQAGLLHAGGGTQRRAQQVLGPAATQALARRSSARSSSARPTAAGVPPARASARVSRRASSSRKASSRTGLRSAPSTRRPRSRAITATERSTPSSMRLIRITAAPGCASARPRRNSTPGSLRSETIRSKAVPRRSRLCAVGASAASSTGPAPSARSCPTTMPRTKSSSSTTSAFMLPPAPRHSLLHEDRSPAAIRVILAAVPRVR